jgi:hypothetical protein
MVSLMRAPELSSTRQQLPDQNYRSGASAN